LVVPDELSPFENDYQVSKEFLPIVEKVKKLWRVVAKQEDPEFDETIEGIQLARLWTVKQYVQQRKQALEKELQEFKSKGLIW